MPTLLEATGYHDARRTPHPGSHPDRSADVRAAGFRMPAAPVWADVVRGRSDPVWAVERFLGVKLNRGQRKWIRAAVLRGPDGWSPAFLTTVVSAGNQAGKTFCMAVLIWLHCFYKLGIRPPDVNDPDDVRRWGTAPYVWYHVSYQQKIARHVYRELTLLFSGDHPAQFDKATGTRRGCPMMTDFGGPIVFWDKAYEGEYEYIRFHAMFGGAQIHFRNTDERGKGLLGLQMNGISFDEAAFEMYLDEVRHLVLNMRRISTGGPIHFISTPDTGSLDFQDLWEEGSPASPNRNPKTIALRLATADNIGYGITQAAYDDMKAQMPEYLWPQNLGGEFIEAKGAYFNAPQVEAMFVGPCTETCEPGCVTHMIEESPPEKAHRYVQGVDPGIAHDATWTCTLDATKRPFLGVRALRSQGKQSLPAIINMVNGTHLVYSTNGATCQTAIDSTGMGGQMFRQEFSAIPGLLCYDFAGTKAQKLKLLGCLRSAMDKGELKVPKTGRFWQELRRQLLSYKLDDAKITQDAVMAFAIAVYYAVRNGVEQAPNASFTFYG